jgi:hypothetical protein
VAAMKPKEPSFPARAFAVSSDEFLNYLVGSMMRCCGYFCEVEILP